MTRYRFWCRSPLAPTGDLQSAFWILVDAEYPVTAVPRFNEIEVPVSPDHDPVDGRAVATMTSAVIHCYDPGSRRLVRGTSIPVLVLGFGCHTFANRRPTPAPLRARVESDASHLVFATGAPTQLESWTPIGEGVLNLTRHPEPTLPAALLAPRHLDCRGVYIISGSSMDRVRILPGKTFGRGGGNGISKSRLAGTRGCSPVVRP